MPRLRVDRLSNVGLDRREVCRLAVAMAAVLALGVVGGCGGHSPHKDSSKESGKGAAKDDGSGSSLGATKVVAIERRNIRMRVEQPGTIQAFESTPIYSKLAGYTENYHVNIGDRVKKDQLLLSMWIPDLVEALNQKKAAVDRAKVQVRVAESSEKAAKATFANSKAHVVSSEAGVKRSQAGYTRWESEYNRLNKLVADQVLNTQVRDETYRQFEEAAAVLEQSHAMVNEAVAGRDKAEADLERAGVDIEAAKADLDVAKTEQRLAQVTVDYGQIKAPYDGVITQRNVSPGDYLQIGGGTGGRPLFVLEQTNPVRVFVGVPELAAGFIKDQDTALIRIQAVAGAFRRGKIVRSGFSLDTTSRTLQTEIDIENADGHLRPGMYVTAEIMIDRQQIYAVPSAAVIFLGGDNYGLDLVEKGKTVRTAVLIGPSDDQYTEVLRKKTSDGQDWTHPDGNEKVSISPVATAAIK